MMQSDVQHAKGSGGQSPDEGLARQLSELARQLQADRDPDAILRHITHATVAEVEGARFAGVSLIETTRVTSRAETDEVVTRVDGFQYSLQEGPCLSALRDQLTVRADDLASEARWPRFAAEVVTLGIRSMLSVQLFVDSDNLGALNMYATDANAFGDDDESTAMMLAAHAAIALKGARVESHLQTALASRDAIGQAKGILMERYKINAVDAFELLVLASQRRNVKLRGIAEEVADTGELRTD